MGGLVADEALLHAEYVAWVFNAQVTSFETRVYDLCSQIPRGQVSTYGDMAKSLGSSPRAVGQALRRNPFAPEVPCHRVVAADRKIGGFSCVDFLCVPTRCVSPDSLIPPENEKHIFNVDATRGEWGKESTLVQKKRDMLCAEGVRCVLAFLQNACRCFILFTHNLSFILATCLRAIFITVTLFST